MRSLTSYASRVSLNVFNFYKNFVVFGLGFPVYSLRCLAGISTPHSKKHPLCYLGWLLVQSILRLNQVLSLSLSLLSTLPLHLFLLFILDRCNDLRWTPPKIYSMWRHISFSPSVSLSAFLPDLHHTYDNRCPEVSSTRTSPFLIKVIIATNRC